MEILKFTLVVAFLQAMFLGFNVGMIITTTKSNYGSKKAGLLVKINQLCQKPASKLLPFATLYRYCMMLHTARKSVHTVLPFIHNIAMLVQWICSARACIVWPMVLAFWGGLFGSKNAFGPCVANGFGAFGVYRRVQK